MEMGAGILGKAISVIGQTVEVENGNIFFDGQEVRIASPSSIEEDLGTAVVRSVDGNKLFLDGFVPFAGDLIKVAEANTDWTRSALNG